MSMVAVSPFARARSAFAYWQSTSPWMRTVDIFAILTVGSLPWSTSLPAIFTTLWVISLVPMVIRDSETFSRLMKEPACFLPLLFVALAVAGLFWSEADWNERLYALKPFGKFLMIPLIIYHFARSERGAWIFVTFLLSCTLLMLLSFLVAYDPSFAINTNDSPGGYGVPLKNYIDQSHEFALCAVALAWPVLQLYRQKRYRLASLLIAIAAAFLFNMFFITVSRTALVTLPVMFAVFALFSLRWRGILTAVASLVLVLAVAWAVSPKVQAKLASIGAEYHRYQTSSDVTSGGLRLEFWRKSVLFISENPFFGHGTGAVLGLFEQAAEHQTGVAAEVIANPHNQTLHVGIQWGALGITILYWMWLTHLALFRNPPPAQRLAAWVGQLVVVQNIASSIFNSHLFDFHAGWMYVLGVGVAGGMIIGMQRDHAGTK